MSYRFAARSVESDDLRFSNAAVSPLFAEQLAADQAAVSTQADKIQEGTTILGIDGTLPAGSEAAPSDPSPGAMAIAL